MWESAHGCDPDSPCGESQAGLFFAGGRCHDVFAGGQRFRNKYAVTYHCGNCRQKVLHIPVRGGGGKVSNLGTRTGRGMRVWDMLRQKVLLLNPDQAEKMQGVNSVIQDVVAWSDQKLKETSECNLTLSAKPLVDAALDADASSSSEPLCTTTTSPTASADAWIFADATDRKAAIVAQAVSTLEDVDAQLADMQAVLTSQRVSVKKRIAKLSSA